jgi:hypothetical protein
MKPNMWYPQRAFLCIYIYIYIYTYIYTYRNRVRWGKMFELVWSFASSGPSTSNSKSESRPSSAWTCLCQLHCALDDCAILQRLVMKWLHSASTRVWNSYTVKGAVQHIRSQGEFMQVPHANASSRRFLDKRIGAVFKGESRLQVKNVVRNQCNGIEDRQRPTQIHGHKYYSLTMNERRWI